MEGDERAVVYRDRIGVAYQAVIEEEGERDEQEDGAVLLSACDLWNDRPRRARAGLSARARAT